MLRETTRKATSSPDLGIELHNPPAFFHAGDSIAGRIYRQTAIISPEATLTINLVGCIATQVNDNPSHVLVLLAFSKSLFSGAVHIPPDATCRQEWSFNIRLPKNPSCKHVMAESFNSIPFFVPIDQDSISVHPLPPTCRTKSPYFYGSVDYYLEAKLCYERKGVKDVVHCQYPLLLRLTDLRPPIADCHLKLHDFKRTIVSQRLVPGMHGAPLTMSQQIKKLFHTSSVPRLTLQILIETPRIIQLNHPDPISLTIKAIPNWSKSSGILQNVPQTARLVRFWAVLKSICEIPTPLHPSFTGPEKYTLRHSFTYHSEPLVEIRCFADEDTMDIGKAINLRLVDPEYLVPDFVTFTMKVTHTLSYEMRWIIEKECVKIQDEQTVIVVPESIDRDKDCQPESSGIIPSNPFAELDDDMDSPPSFEEAEKEKESQIDAQNQPKGKATVESEAVRAFSDKEEESGGTRGGE
ncbi:unnamed protein product [Clonostachys rosea]|uniref:Arrestin-like N-terminal domain-containing protein n=1 Tax=Bionectria ochroleuca TaxID=29856 RepID=A0ABY6TU85_BIOOC|nr:unnamed protein product [Clonostachys rosea]